MLHLRWKERKLFRLWTRATHSARAKFQRASLKWWHTLVIKLHLSDRNYKRTLSRRVPRRDKINWNNKDGELETPIESLQERLWQRGFFFSAFIAYFWKILLWLTLPSCEKWKSRNASCTEAEIKRRDLVFLCEGPPVCSAGEYELSARRVVRFKHWQCSL